MKIEVGKYYRHRSHPTYAWAKVLEIIPPRTGVNTHSYRIAECEYRVDKGSFVGVIKYFRLSDLVKG